MVNFPPIALISNAQEMHDLFIRYFNGEMSPQEKKELFQKLQQSPEDKKVFAGMQNAWALSSLSIPVNHKLAAFKLAQFKKNEKKRYFVKYIRPVLGYAAAVVVAVAATWAVLTQFETSLTKEAIAGYEEFSTPAGQRAKMTLYDGTVVWLNASSTLKYPNRFSDDVRRVELDGEAYFEVKHNKKVPFIVSTEKMNIRVLGTKFNVFAYKGKADFTTTLVEGSVRISDNNDASRTMLLKPSETAELRGNKLFKTTYKNENLLLWRTGIYSFDDVTFSEMVKKLELYYDVTIHVNNNELIKNKFTAKFRQRDGIESVLRTLQKAYSFRFEKDEEKNIITIK